MAVALAWLLLAAGMVASNISANDYTVVLLTAISCAGAAALLLIFAFWRGGLIIRVAAFFGLAPLIFIVCDFLRRF